MPENQVNLSWEDVRRYARFVANEIFHSFENFPRMTHLNIYGVPRGGTHAAQAVLTEAVLFHIKFNLVENVEEADFIVDDIIDSGKTQRDCYGAWPDKPFFALIDKSHESSEYSGKWVKFPWETDETRGPEENVRRIIQFIGDDPNREGLVETPSRVVKAYREMFTGYHYSDVNIREMLKVFTDGSCKEMVLVKNIEFVSFCEHHMLSFQGLAHIAYIPNGTIVGLSKIARLLDVYSRRLQVQERLTQQVTTALDTHLQPLGSACVIEAKHSCMSCRGVMKQQSSMITSSLTGEFIEKPEVRAEFMSLIRG